MCGIAGILDLHTSRIVEEGTIRQMLALIRHRGPDQFGIYLDDHIGLGNARLSIIDLGGGQQPITNEDGSLWIVYNGEVFNYRELRRDLEAKGHRFTTHTDTEVILHLFEEHGPGCLSLLNGQFALAIWNRVRRELFLARDRLGVRPLFYTLADGVLVFASEIKALLAAPGVRAEIDPVTLDQIFTYWSQLSPRTVFRGVVEVPPAHHLVAREGQVRVTPYWQLGFVSEADSEWAPRRTDDDYCLGLRDLLIDATRLRLRADVPVGAYLSGGLDSSTIAAIVRRYGTNRLDTFSIAFSDPEYDESPFQRQMASFLGTDHQVVYATHEDIGRVFPDVIWHTETPVMRTAPAPMFLLSKLVRDRQFKVVLTGEGADEFLAGYDLFKEAKIRRFWARQPASRWRPRLLQRLYPDIAELGQNSPAFLAAFFGERLTATGEPGYSHAVRWRNNRRTRRFFSDELAESIARECSGSPPGVCFPADFGRWGPLERSQYLEASIFLSQYLLSSQGDRPAMAHSVEGRFPFLDHRVVDYCCRLPARLKLRGLTEKYILKRLAREWLPLDVWRRPKRPYRAPIHRSFFNAAAADYVTEMLSETRLKRTGFFKPAAVSQLCRKVSSGQHIGETDDMALTGIISTQLVHHLFLERFIRPEPLSDRDDVKVCRGSRPA